MKKVKFVFKDNDTIVYDEMIEYAVEDEWVVFSLDKAEYRFKLGKELMFKRTSAEGCLVLNANHCSYRLFDGNLEIAIRVLKFKYEIDNNYHFIEYTIESDESSTKTMKLFFE